MNFRFRINTAITHLTQQIQSLFWTFRFLSVTSHNFRLFKMGPTQNNVQLDLPRMIWFLVPLHSPVIIPNREHQNKRKLKIWHHFYFEAIFQIYHQKQTAWISIVKWKKSILIMAKKNEIMIFIWNTVYTWLYDRVTDEHHIEGFSKWIFSIIVNLNKMWILWHHG